MKRILEMFARRLHAMLNGNAGSDAGSTGCFPPEVRDAREWCLHVCLDYTQMQTGGHRCSSSFHCG